MDSNLSDKSRVLRTNRLLLRPFVDSDLEFVFKGLSHPDVIRYYGVRYETLEASKDQMRFFSDLEKNQTGIWWAVCSPDNQTFYGAGGLNGVIKEHRKGEIGFWLLPEFWAMGFMSEALPVICNFGFDQLGLHRIEGIVESDNFRCKNSIVKMGFQHEGTMVDCELKDGRYINLDIFAKLNK